MAPRSKSPARKPSVQPKPKAHVAAPDIGALGSPWLLGPALVLLPIYVHTACHLASHRLPLATLYSVPEVPGIEWSHISAIGGFWLLQVLLRWAIPGPQVVPANGGSYTCNGRSVLLLSLFLVGAAGWTGVISSSWFSPYHFMRLLTVSQIFAFAATLGVYLLPEDRSHETGNVFVDVFMGVALNPRIIPSLTCTDLKFIIESQALVMWLILDYGIVWHAGWSLRAGLMLVLHTVYVFHHFLDESFLLNTLDFTSDPMGFMLTWGNIVYVSFSFTLTTWAAVGNPAELSPVSALLICLFAGYGLLMFSQANHQKHAYRTDPNNARIWGEVPRVMPTERGTKLLICGWYSIARHANYCGDLILALSAALIAGPDYFMSWTYFGYLFVLLVHRARRDNEYCAAKYGADWDKYCAITPYTILPGVW